MQNNRVELLFVIKMKTIASIPLILLILFTGTNVKFATHYCGGSVAATKISLNGELATCGMEHSTHSKSLQQVFTRECCEDYTTSYSFCGNYFPTVYSTNEVYKHVISVIDTPPVNHDFQEYIPNQSFTSIRPPGTYSPNSVSQPSLCIFRI